MKNLIISPRAADDIDEIYDYTEARWGQDQAEDYTFGIRQALQEACRGTREGKSIDHIRKGAMSLSFRSHYLIYQEKAASLILIRILHSA
jgi:toxin ParE1/3/4